MLQQYLTYLNVCITTLVFLKVLCITVTELCLQMLVWSTNTVYEVKECKLLTVT